jgi:leucyl aminopeptidase
VVAEADAAAFLSGLPEAQRAWVTAVGFTGSLGQVVVLPGADGAPAGALMGFGSPVSRRRGRFHVAKAAGELPSGVWALAGNLTAEERAEAALGWLLGSYRFDRYKSASAAKARLKAPEGLDVRRIEVLANSEALTRDLVNTPASDMGPEDLEGAFVALAAEYGAVAEAIVGPDLVSRNFPMIHAVGRASDRAPRLLDMRWGDAGPTVTLVGKGVCFDTGGLDLKTAPLMGLMKKDMGGAATVMGLARSIMALKLPVRLRVLVPAVENAVSGNAFRPGDILTSRKGLTVEINNTDAEGRLILADALAYADEEKPDLIVSMATLTGAARVAVGPDLAPFYTDDESLAAALAEAGAKAADPVWRMPFWDPYEAMIEPGIADLDNAPSGGFAGSVTAALFLRRFVTAAPRYAHFDIYCWQPTAQPGRPKGGVGQGARAILEALAKVFTL